MKKPTKARPRATHAGAAQTPAPALSTSIVANLGTSSAILPLGAMLFASWLPGAALAADTTLPTVEIKDQYERDVGYQANTTKVGKLPQLVKDIPQAVTVVTESLMHDQNANTLKEALGNVSGLTFNAGEGGRIGDNMNLRGFYSFGDLYLDGIRDVAQYNRETFNLQQIDVLRGSAAMLFGRGQAGGVINQASKEAALQNGGQVSGTIGSHDYKRVTADINRVLGKTTAVRLNAMKTDAGSSREHVKSEREGLAPTLAWGLGTPDTFTLGHYYLKTHNVPDYGVPFFNQKPLDVPATRFYGTTSDYEDNLTNISTATYQHRFSADSNIRTVLRGANYKRDLWVGQPQLRLVSCATGTVTSVSDANCINRSIKSRGGEEDNLTSQTDYTGKFAVGGMKHEVLAGLELLKENAARWSYAYTGTVPTTTVGNPNASPTGLPGDYGNRSKLSPASYKGLTTALYGQDSIEFTPGWKVLLGARHDKMDADYSNGAKVDYGEWSYRSGLSWQPSDTSHYYLAFSDSFNPTADLYQFTTTSSTAPAERSRTLELGAKWELLDGNLSLRTSLYRAEKEWERNTDVESAANAPTAANPYPNLLTRKRHTDGIEFEAYGHVTNNWEIFSGLSLMRALVDEAKPGGSTAIVGLRPRNAPPYTFNLWSTYRFGEGAWKAGGGVTAVGSRLAYGIPNGTATVTPNRAPAYQRWDAMLAYKQPGYELKLNLLNVFDTRYYESVYENGGHAVPGTSRTVQLSGEYSF